MFGKKSAEQIVNELNDLPMTDATQAKRDKLVGQLAKVAEVLYTPGQVCYDGKPVTRPGSIRDRSKR